MTNRPKQVQSKIIQSNKVQSKIVQSKKNVQKLRMKKCGEFHEFCTPTCLTKDLYMCIFVRKPHIHVIKLVKHGCSLITKHRTSQTEGETMCPKN